MNDYFKMMFAYNFWANSRVLESLKNAANAPEPSVKLLSHILAAEELWCCRLTGKTTDMQVFPQFSLAECELRIVQQNETWNKYLADISVAGLSEIITYHNTKGVPFLNTPIDILAHVINHGTYHRGQIAQQLRQSGEIPAATDYIVYVR